MAIKKFDDKKVKKLGTKRELAQIYGRDSSESKVCLFQIVVVWIRHHFDRSMRSVFLLGLPNGKFEKEAAQLRVIRFSFILFAILLVAVRKASKRGGPRAAAVS